MSVEESLLSNAIDILCDSFFSAQCTRTALLYLLSMLQNSQGLTAPGAEGQVQFLPQSLQPYMHLR